MGLFSLGVFSFFAYSACHVAGDGVHQRWEHRVLRRGHPDADGRPEGPAAHHHARRATPAQQDIRQGTAAAFFWAL